MKSPFATWKSVVATFVLAALFYALAYSWFTRKQTGKGPWEASFMTNSAGVPQLVISEPALGISNTIVQFIGERLAPTNETGTVAFARPQTAVPFCQLIYDDLMFQPGVVTLDCFGHVIEMTPRVLGLNGKRFGWTNNIQHTLVPSNKMPMQARKKLKGGYGR